MTLGLRQPRLTWLQRTRGPGPLISAGPPGRPGGHRGEGLFKGYSIVSHLVSPCFLTLCVCSLPCLTLLPHLVCLFSPLSHLASSPCVSVLPSTLSHLCLFLSVLCVCSSLVSSCFLTLCVCSFPCLTLLPHLVCLFSPLSHLASSPCVSVLSLCLTFASSPCVSVLSLVSPCFLTLCVCSLSLVSPCVSVLSPCLTFCFLTLCVCSLPCLTLLPHLVCLFSPCLTLLPHLVCLFSPLSHLASSPCVSVLSLVLSHLVCLFSPLSHLASSPCVSVLSLVSPCFLTFVCLFSPLCVVSPCFLTLCACSLPCLTLLPHLVCLFSPCVCVSSLQKRKGHHGGFSIVILIWPELESDAFFQQLRVISHSKEGESIDPWAQEDNLTLDILEQKNAIMRTIHFFFFFICSVAPCSELERRAGQTPWLMTSSKGVTRPQMILTCYLDIISAAQVLGVMASPGQGWAPANVLLNADLIF
ncbi:hypothetical protein CEXT_81701 [Caerostris extrusa]|uniref:Uncharacterized protein n=1 Tax=Caerostris extrusa TaxID=172846 RepID=A0AAV4TV16_CAEEX|nr:hypothetical protein CEXT_81701 [Caerostris extrusa]